MFIVNNLQLLLDIKLKKINANKKRSLYCFHKKTIPEKILKTTIYTL